MISQKYNEDQSNLGVKGGKTREELSASVNSLLSSSDHTHSSYNATLSLSAERLDNVYSHDSSIQSDSYHFIRPFLDAGGSATSICLGLFYLFLVGLLLGLLMPKNPALHTIWYQYTSSVIGYTYFTFWCASFYPQVMTNYKRKSTEGLSADFSTVNFIGYICYALYTCSLYWNREVQDLYRKRYGSEMVGEPKISVQSNDVAFALHAVLFSGVWLIQLIVYGGFKLRQGTFPVSKSIQCFIIFVMSSVSLYVFLLWKFVEGKNGWPDWITARLNWLDFIYFLSFIKIAVTLCKYIPQVLLNAR